MQPKRVRKIGTQLNFPIDLYISLGSNIEPATNLASARDELLGRLDNAQISPVYQSPAVGMEGAEFLNAVVGGTTFEPLQSIVGMLHKIELAHGRVRTANKFSDRTLDLDLLLYGSQVSNPDLQSRGATAIAESVVLPHPEILQQAYVLQPLADLAGNKIHPVCGITINEILTRFRQKSPALLEALQPFSLDDNLPS